MLSRIAKHVVSKTNRMEWPARFCLAFVLAAAILVIYAATVQAATDDSLEELYNMLKDWMTGYLGKLIALTGLAVGIGMAVTGHLTYGLIAFAIAALAAFGPGIIEDIFTSQ